MQDRQQQATGAPVIDTVQFPEKSQYRFMNHFLDVAALQLLAVGPGSRTQPGPGLGLQSFQSIAVTSLRPETEFSPAFAVGRMHTH
ncbi:MAG: hypothetical protein ACKPHU_35400, partial [Planctomycetaceae bacterium]